MQGTQPQPHARPRPRAQIRPHKQDPSWPWCKWTQLKLARKGATRWHNSNRYWMYTARTWVRLANEGLNRTPVDVVADFLHEELGSSEGFEYGPAATHLMVGDVTVSADPDKDNILLLELEDNRNADTATYSYFKVTIEPLTYAQYKAELPNDQH